MSKIGVDPRCVELAHLLLADVSADNDTLALDLGARIQRHRQITARRPWHCSENCAACVSTTDRAKKKADELVCDGCRREVYDCRCNPAWVDADLSWRDAGRPE